MGSDSKHSHSRRHVRRHDRRKTWIAPVVVAVSGIAVLSMTLISSYYDLPAVTQATHEITNMYSGTSANSSSCSSPNRHHFTKSVILRFAKSTSHTSVWDSPESKAAKEFLQHDDRFFEKTRMFVGDEDRERTFLMKLSRKKCTKILICGGSNSVGSGLEDKANTFWSILREWINVNFPCGKEHIVSRECVRHGSGVHHAIANLNRFFGVNSDWDLIIAEYSVNDFYREAQFPDLRFHSEIFLRRVLSLPSYPWLIFLSIGLRQWGEDSDSSQDIFSGSGQYEQLKLTAFYGVTQLSWTNAVLSQFMSNRLERNKHTWEKFPWSLVKAKEIEGPQHINVFAHSSVALTLAHYFERSLCYIPYSTLNNLSARRGSRMKLQEKLPLPIYNPDEVAARDLEFQKRLSEASVKMETTNLYFDDGDVSDGVKRYFASFVTESHPDGAWEIVSETSKKKVGFLSTTVGSYFTLNVTCRDEIYVSYLQSYEHMGTAMVWLDHSPSVKPNTCGSYQSSLSMQKNGFVPKQVLDALETTSKASVQEIRRFDCTQARTPTTMFLHVCIVQSQPSRVENKWKLLGVGN